MMRPLRRYQSAFVILNPISGTYNPKKVQQELLAFLRPRCQALAFRVTLGQGDAAQYTREALAAHGDLLVLAAGDGTIREVLHVLAGNPAAPALALIPVGSANVLARELRIPLSVSKALELIDRHRVLLMDLGFLPDRDEHFALMLTTGFHARLIQDTTREAKRKYGFFAYFRSVFKHLWHFADAEATITIDGVLHRVHSENILVTNINLLGFEPLRLGPDVRLDDGVLDIVVFEHASTFRFFHLLAHHLLTPLRPDPRVHFFRGRDIAIAFHEPVPVQVDGDPLSAPLPVRIQAVPKAVRVLVPEE